MRVVIIDNFDSFTHNLAQAFGGLGADALVVRNDADPSDILALRPDRLVLSPGPGTPDRTGACAEVLRRAQSWLPTLGVCLGMQLLARETGASVVRAARPVHGKATLATHDGQGVFEGLESPCGVGRYHSLVVDAATLPAQWMRSAWSDDVLMGIRHVALPLEGVQFHPESILTPEGPRILANFLAGRGLATPEGGRAR